MTFTHHKEGSGSLARNGVGGAGRELSRSGHPRGLLRWFCHLPAPELAREGWGGGVITPNIQVWRAVRDPGAPLPQLCLDALPRFAPQRSRGDLSFLPTALLLQGLVLRLSPRQAFERPIPARLFVCLGAGTCESGQWV